MHHIQTPADPLCSLGRHSLGCTDQRDAPKVHASAGASTGMRVEDVWTELGCHKQGRTSPGTARTGRSHGITRRIQAEAGHQRHVLRAGLHVRGAAASVGEVVDEAGTHLLCAGRVFELQLLLRGLQQRVCNKQRSL